MPRKNIQKLIFPKTQQTRSVFSEGRYLYLDERKKQTWKPLTTQTGRAMENFSETRRRIVETRRFHIKLFMSICTTENSSHPAEFFFCWIFSHCYLIRYTRWGLVFYIIFIFYSTLKQDQSTDFHKTEKERLYCTHCQTNMRNFLISLFYYNQQ